MHPHIINSNIPSIATEVIPIRSMDNFPILIRLRPPRYDLYSRIIAATGVARERLKYSFVMDYIRGGAGTIFARQGLCIKLPGELFVILSAAIDNLPQIHEVVPVVFNDLTPDEFVEVFCTVNESFADYITSTGTQSVFMAKTSDTEAIIFPVLD